MKRVFVVVLDSAGVGALPDAASYGDEDSNTLVHTAEAVGGINLPNLARLGLGRIAPIPGVPAASEPEGAFGRAAEMAPGKDTTTGHWEMMGCVLVYPLKTFPNGFPPELIAEFERRIGRKILGNKVASGTEIIEELGQEHLHTGYPIVYTSADSVFQIAAHEEVIPVQELYEMCRIARELLVDEYAVGRVIARPFVGKPGAFERTPRRHDFSLSPTGETVLDRLQGAGREVIAVGKIVDIFAGRGITRSISTASNREGIERTLELADTDFCGLAFTNLVDFDMKYGHRNDAVGYAAALEEFDSCLPALMSTLGSDDALIITADHGCDPTTRSTDHSREYVPILVFGPGLNKGVDLGTRSSFADTGKTVLELLGVDGEGLPGEGYAHLLGGL